MPKLLQINITANWGSTGKIAESIGVTAMKHGWESYIAYGRWCNSSQSHLIKVGTKLDMYLHYVEQKIFDNEGLCSRGATKRLIQKIIQISPDVVHLHNIHDHYLNYKILFDYLNHTNIKVVWTFHDCWAFTGHCFHFITKNCMRWKIRCHDCPLHHLYPNTFFDRSENNYVLKNILFTANNNLTIVAVSDWIAGFIRESFLKHKRIEVIKNGVDIDIFKPLQSKCIKGKNTKFKIIAVSNVWYPNKGELDIYKLRQLLDIDLFEITMVGLSANQVKGLPEGIKGIQRTQNTQELAKLYSESDVLINPTYEDNFPTVNLEALACGIPVITYRTGGSSEAIDSNTGFVIEQGNLVELANSIIYLKDHPFLSNICREGAVKLFDKNMCFENYIKLYNELLRI